jgi:sortase (surface protein transpeptidase)
MTDRAAPASASWWRALATLLVLLAVVCLVVWSDRQPAASEDSARTSDPSASALARPAAGTATKAATAASPEADPGRPVRLAIPDLGLDTRLITLGVRPDKTVEVPSDPDRAGWFRRGPTPGAIGSSVILGHVDSVDGPAVFAGLADLTAGARITAHMEDGSQVTFAVRSVRTYANEAFPARKVYGSHGRSELNLVTCGGVYDASRGGYQSNVVVNARLV